MSTIGGKKIATKGSGHVCPGPTPAMSLVPPVPPAPAPFAYIALSSSASDTAPKLKVGGDEVLVVGSSMDVQMPGNVPSQPTGGDVVTHMVNKAAGVFTGSSKVKAGGKDVACTLDQARLNMPIGKGMVAQVIGKLVTPDMIKTAANQAKYAADQLAILDPISVASGAVVDEAVDLAIRGLIAVQWRRSYSSARLADLTPLGRGGWTHAYHQWVTIGQGGKVELREGDGSTLVFEGVTLRETAFLRRKRLELRLDGKGGATVRALDSRMTRVFATRSGGRVWLTEMVDDCGRKVRLEYEGEHLVRVIDPASRRLELAYDGSNRVIRIDAFGPPRKPAAAPKSLQHVEYAYDEDGRLVSVTDALGNTERFAYDLQHRLSMRTVPGGHSFHWRYDPESGRCVRAWGDGEIHLGELEYDVDKGITRVSGNPEPRIYKWRTKDGAILSRATPDGTLVDETIWDDDDYLLEAKNAAGHGPRYEHDERGNLVRFTEPGGDEVEFAYAEDLPVRRTYKGNATEFAWDRRGLLEEVRYASGAFLRLAWDERGRLASLSGPDGLRHAYRYDAADNCIEETSARGGVRRSRFDDLGRPIELVDALGGRSSRELDALGRPVTVRHPDGSVISLVYDADSRLIERVDELGRRWKTRWAGVRSPVELEQPDASAWRLAFDLLERPQTIRNPAGETWELRYDRAGNVREMRTFDGRIARWTYDKTQRVARMELPDGTWRTYRYDPNGEVVAEDAPHGAVTIDRTPEATEYLLDDPQGAFGVLLSRDAFGRVIGEAQPAGRLDLAHDIQNRRIECRTSAGTTTRYAYDEESNLVAINHDGRRAALTRNLAGRVVAIAFPGGAEWRRVINPVTRVTRDWVGSGSDVLVDRSYEYDAGSALVARHDRRWGDARYGYDALGRLVEAHTPAGHERFEYDAAGGIRPAGEDWSTRAGSVLTRTPAATYEHDQGGRRIKRHGEDGATTEYYWDCRGRLREVVLPDRTRVLYAYDPLGRLTRKQVIEPVRMASPDALPEREPAERAVAYLWDNHALVAEIDGERGTRVWIHEPKTLVPVLMEEIDKDGARRLFGVITDHIGTVTELVDDSGRLAWSALHSTWGRVTKTTGEIAAPPHRLLGQYWDEDAGLCYVRYRWFDPETMRFLGPDPLELAGGPNLYAFNGNPTMHADPLGLACILIGDPRKDSFLKYIMDNRVPCPGQYEVYVHGTSTGVAYQDGAGKWDGYTPQQLQDRINAAGNYGGGPIYLNSCNTGRIPNGVASQMSSGFGTTVTAPNDLVWGQGQNIGPAVGMGPSDEYLPANQAPGTTPTYDPSRPGQWNQWTNGQANPNNAYRPTNAWHP